MGAGISGLSCARRLVDAGIPVRLLEKSRGVGGRCATRRIEGRPVDHGLTFFHGTDPGFLQSLRSVDSERAVEWPRRVEGQGTPCQPRALRPEQTRLAYASGASVFPKHLARGLPLELNTRVTGLTVESDGWLLQCENDSVFRARTIVLSAPTGQTLDLLLTADPGEFPILPTLGALLESVSMVRCVTVMAGYPEGIQVPGWDVRFPEESAILQLISQDSAKRTDPIRPVFVFQARPAWSAEHWESGPDAWIEAVLEEARSICGAWAGEPVWTDTQRWRYARLAGGDGLTEPLLFGLPGGRRVGIAGEALASGGGVEAAWISGRRMAERLIGESTA